MPRIPEKCRTIILRTRLGVVRGWGCVRRRIVPAEGLGALDMALLRWGLLCLAVLLPVGVLQMTDSFAGVEAWQVGLLRGSPFLMTDEEVHNVLLGRGALFGLCTLATLYLAMVLLHERDALRRTQLCALAAIALGLPGLLCALWHGVFHMVPLLLCVALLWVLTFIPFFHPATDREP